MEIKVLGPGCAKCTKAEKIIKEVIAEKNIEASVEKVTDMLEIAQYGVMGTPAVVINGEVKCVGKIPDKKEIISWLA